MRTKKSSLYLFNFCEVPAGHSMVTWSLTLAGLPCTGSTSKLQIKTKHKNEWLSKNISSGWKPFKDFGQKKQNHNSWHCKTNQWNTRVLDVLNKHGKCNHDDEKTKQIFKTATTVVTFFAAVLKFFFKFSQIPVTALITWGKVTGCKIWDHGESSTLLTSCKIDAIHETEKK